MAHTGFQDRLYPDNPDKVNKMVAQFEVSVPVYVLLSTKICTCYQSVQPIYHIVIQTHTIHTLQDSNKTVQSRLFTLAH